jgi:DNA adenine methylase
VGKIESPRTLPALTKPGNLLPLLRWAGSKKRQFASYNAFFPEQYNAYVEPFAGSAAFFFRIQPRRARLNDINPNVIDFYSYVKRDPSSFYDGFRAIRRSEIGYYKARTRFNDLASCDEKSILFYFLNRNCFNGIFRLNKNGNFNVPYSSSKVSPYLSKSEFIDSAELLRRVLVKRMDFEIFCERHASPNDFVYLDPPYYSDSQRIFNEYNARPFDAKDLARLFSLLLRLDKRGVKFLLSFPKCDQTEALAKIWNHSELSVFRSVAGNPDMRRTQSEMLIFNYDQTST